MTFAEQFQNHKCGLVRLRSQLYWYDSNSYDNTPGRVCLLLDAWHELDPVGAVGALAVAVAATPRSHTRTHGSGARYAAHLLIDGQPRWVWMTEEDVEIL